MLRIRCFRLASGAVESVAAGLSRLPSMFWLSPTVSRSIRGLVSWTADPRAVTAAAKSRRHFRGGRHRIVDDGGEAVPDALEAGEAGVEAEEGRADAEAEGEALRLGHPRPVGALVPDEVVLPGGDVGQPDGGLELPAAAEEERQVDAGVPVEPGRVLPDEGGGDEQRVARIAGVRDPGAVQVGDVVLEVPDADGCSAS